MPPADKRARKKENARAAREQREAAARRRKRTRSTITAGIAVAVFIGVILLLNATGGSGKKGADPKLDASKTYVATINTNFGVVKIQLDPKTAPIGSAHFVNLARKHVYDGSAFTRILKDFVVQGGAPGGDPTKDYGHSVVAEVPTGKYALGDVAAAKKQTEPFGTFDSQFFIVVGSQGVALPPQYADFGKVTSGVDIVQKIEALPTDANGAPTGKKATISTVTIAES